MKRKILKGIALALALALIVGVSLFANALVGNPVSKLLATNTANAYIAEKFPGGDFVLERVTFSFKDGNYHAYLSSPGSVDSSFSLTVSMGGKLLYDYYENNVLSGWNTAMRLDTEYREVVDRIFESPSFPYATDIAFGELSFISEVYKDEPDVPSYALVTEDLVLDGLYDLQELGAKAGKLTVYFYEDTVTVQRLAEMLLEVRSVFDEAGISFYTVDCVLQLPKPEEGSWPEDRVEVMDFLYSDIYAENLIDRVTASNEKAKAYYLEMDKEKGLKE